MHRGAFTLVELVAVIVVLAVLAGVAIPKYHDMGARARVSSAKYARSTLESAVQHWRLDAAVNGAAAWPATLDIVLQSTQGDQFLNPYRLTAQPVYLPDPDNSPAKWHPIFKTVEERMQSAYKGCIWYNNTNGAVRFCVPEQSTTQATISLYNEVNSCAVTSIGQTSP